MAFEHNFAAEHKVEPNDEPRLGRVNVVAVCECGEERVGFAQSAMIAWSRALRKLRDHIEDEVRKGRS